MQVIHTAPARVQMKNNSGSCWGLTAHMFTDVAALAVSLMAIRIGRRAADRKRTFGYQRFEILAAAYNARFIFPVALYILY